MTEYELTPTMQRGYDGYMPDSSPQEQTSTPVGGEVLPAPSEATRSLHAADSGQETDVAPPQADAKAQLHKDQEGLANSKRTTKEYLANIAKEMQHPKSPIQVRQLADQVYYAAKVLERNLKGTDLQQFRDNRILATAEELVKQLDGYKENSRNTGGDNDAVRAASLQMQ